MTDRGHARPRTRPAGHRTHRSGQRRTFSGHRRGERAAVSRMQGTERRDLRGGTPTVARLARRSPATPLRPPQAAAAPFRPGRPPPPSPAPCACSPRPRSVFLGDSPRRPRPLLPFFRGTTVSRFFGRTKYAATRPPHQADQAGAGPRADRRGQLAHAGVSSRRGRRGSVAGKGLNGALRALNIGRPTKAALRWPWSSPPPVNWPCRSAAS